MPKPKRMCIAIGISSAPPLPFLRGALNGARDFYNWAQSDGYQSELLTDEQSPVTIDILRQQLESMLSGAAQDIFRFILYFAGHGLIREAEEGLWLLSDWNKQLRAVAVEVLKRRLYMYGVQQISIFADACRSLPTDMNAADLVADAVLGRGPVKPTLTPYIDKFIAAQDGATTFAVPGRSPAQDRCLFTGVLMEGLWGLAPSAISPYFPNKVTSQSLGQFLLVEVPKRAQTYKRTLSPTVQPLFPLGSDVYFGDTAPPPTPPVFSPWPDPTEVLSLGFASEIPILRSIDIDRLVITDSNSELDLPAELSKAEQDLKEPVAPIPPPPDPGEVLKARIQTQEIPTHFETGSGLAVDGTSIHAVWLPLEFTAGSGGRPDWWHVGAQSAGYLDRPAQMLIETQDGSFLAITALPQLIASCVSDAKGTQALVYRELFAPVDTGALAASAISQMESGALRADSLSALAAQLRKLKHVDPTLGVISAYLYDSIGDVANIRRTACFYVENGQAIPYDIVLLAQVEAQWNTNRRQFEASIPDVPSQEPRNDIEREHPWTCCAMKAATGVVAGFWPWMRQGWAFLDAPLDIELGLILPGIAEMRTQLTSARFTTFSKEGGKKLASLFRMHSLIPA